MVPALCVNDYVICWRYGQYRVGDLVVVDHPAFGVIVKRILRHWITEVGVSAYYLSGDHSESTSTEVMGVVESDHLLGKVVWIVRPRG